MLCLFLAGLNFRWSYHIRLAFAWVLGIHTAVLFLHGERFNCWEPSQPVFVFSLGTIFYFSEAESSEPLFFSLLFPWVSSGPRSALAFICFVLGFLAVKLQEF